MSERFPRARRLALGYQRRQVEEFLGRVEAALHPDGATRPAACVSPAEIRRVGFSLVRRGYDVAAVDVELDRLEEQVAAMRSRCDAMGPADSPADPAVLHAVTELPRGQRFDLVPAFHRGYDLTQVDAFLDRVREHLGGGQRLGVGEVRAASFRPRRGGYREDSVDDFLDSVVDLVLHTGVEQPGR